MLDVQTALESMTALLDNFFRGLEQCGLVSAYIFSVETSTDRLEPTKRCLPLMIALIRPLEAGIKTLLEQHGNENVLGDVADSIGAENNQEQHVVEKETKELAAGPGAALPVDDVQNSKRTEEHISESSNNRLSHKHNLEVNKESKFIEKTVKYVESKALQDTEIKQKAEGNFDSHSKCPPYVETVIKTTTTAKTISLKPSNVVENASNNIVTLNDKTDEILEIMKTPNDDTYSVETENLLEKEGEIQMQFSPHPSNTILKSNEKTDEKLRIIKTPNDDTDSVRTSDLLEKGDGNHLQISTLQQNEEKSKKGEEIQHELEPSTTLELQKTKEIKPPKVCDMCGQNLPTLTALQDHFRDTHDGAGCFSCNICKRRFMRKLSFKRHLDTHEPSTLRAVCEICGKSFKRADYLHRHYKFHSGSKPYKCSICKKDFRCAAHLKNHQNAVHFKNKPHRCEMCGHSFSRSDKLKEHILRHLNIKRYSCGICSREYSERRDLTKHLTHCKATVD